MTPIVAFLVGLLIGWLVEWIIDWIYWRRKNEMVQPERVDPNRGRVAELEQEIASYKDQIASLQMDVTRAADAPLANQTGRFAENKVPLVEQAPVQDRLEDIQGVTQAMAQQLNSAGIYSSADLGALQPAKLKDILGDQVLQPAEIVKQARLMSGMIKKVDDLEVINGIGPVIARTLNNAGIFTFSELSSLTVQDLREIVGDRIQRLADEEELLAQARQLAEVQARGG
jgi:predicted flap endonuclease-1-like 5' DNA nuclease